ncbi:MAG: phosphoribosyltransferase [Acidobacteriota bacterium]
MTFMNRADAGRQLATSLRSLHLVRPLVVGITRGGVPVAAEVARLLGIPLDICVVSKLVADGATPITIGAVAEGDVGYIDDAIVAQESIARERVEQLAVRELAEVARQAKLLRDRPPAEVRGRDVILVDDGLLSGGTVHAAVWSLRKRGATRITLAVPVANSAALAAVRADLDRVVCLESDPELFAIGARFREVWPVSEAEIIDLLAGVPGGGREALEVAPLI